MSLLNTARSQQVGHCGGKHTSRLTKKSLVSVSGAAVSTPAVEPSALAPSTRMPPTSAVISVAESESMCACMSR